MLKKKILIFILLPDFSLSSYIPQKFTSLTLNGQKLTLSLDNSFVVVLAQIRQTG